MSGVSIRCNACHDRDGCHACMELNAERDARFAPMADKGRMDRAIDAAKRAWEDATKIGLGRRNCWLSSITAALHSLGIA